MVAIMIDPKMLFRLVAALAVMVVAPVLQKTARKLPSLFARRLAQPC